MPRRLKLTIAYDGTPYHGFQRQSGQITVQQALEEGLAGIFGEPVRLNAAGRTDAGVHAMGQVVSLTTGGRIPTENIPAAARGALPPSIAVLAAEEMPADFNARRAARGKRYIYKITENCRYDPCLANYTWQLGRRLDLEKLRQAAAYLIGEHDFSSFRASGSAATHPVRTVWRAEWTRQTELLLFTIEGDGFLYHMVRNIVGSLVETHDCPEDFTAIIKARDRRAAGKTAPPQGLYLAEVFYK